jgi:type IV secretion system protein TrbL
MWNSTGNKNRIRVITLFSLVVTGVLFYSSPATAAEFGTISAFTQGMLETFRTSFQSFENKVHQAALALFAALFLCQFAWSVIQLMLTESLTFASVVATVIRQVMTGAFFYWLLFDRSILKGIVDSFSQLANSGLSFTDLLFFMETAMQNIMTAVQGRGGLTLEGIALFFSGLAASLVLSYALTTAVGYMAIVLLENYIVGSLGLILLGFGGSDYTRNYALSYIKALVHIGFKLFLVTVIIYVGTYSFTRTTGGMVGSGADSLIQTCMMLIGQSFLFVAVIKVIPQISDTLIAGVSMSTSSGAYALRSGVMGAAGLAAGAVTAGYNAPGKAADAIGGGVSAVQSAASAYSANFGAYRSKGLNSVRAGVSALGSTLWAGYQASRGHQTAPQNSMASNPGTSPGTGTAASKSNNSNVSQTVSVNDPVQNPTVIKDAPKTTEAPDSETADQKDTENSYSAPSPEELSKRFKAWS